MPEILGASVALLAVLFGSTWLLSLRTKDVSIVDVLWGLAFVAVAWLACGLGDGSRDRRVLLAALVSAWGLRLATHLAVRKRGEGEDRRYAAMRRKWGSSFARRSLVSVFALQAVLVLVVSLPITAVATRGPHDLGWLDLVGAAVWLVGFTFEAVGDVQLTVFKGDPANQGKVMDRGLWRYTRHPNYFGDATAWWGIWLIAVAGHAWWTLPGPLVMTWLLSAGSGKPILERGMAKRRPDYAAYVERTSGFVPLPPRRS